MEQIRSGLLDRLRMWLIAARFSYCLREAGEAAGWGHRLDFGPEYGGGEKEGRGYGYPCAFLGPLNKKAPLPPPPPCIPPAHPGAVPPTTGEQSDSQMAADPGSLLGLLIIRASSPSELRR